MLEAIKEAQDILDAYNARWPQISPYILVRVSHLHPTVHIALQDGLMTVCGTHLYKGTAGDPVEGKRLCDRCNHQLQRRF